MLSRSTSRSSQRGLLQLQQVGRRHFDYLAVANRVDKGESIEAQIAAAEKEKAQDASKFSWDFTKWYEKHNTRALPDLNEIKGTFQKFEQYVGGQAVSAKTNIDFGSFREKIADRKFVDELEIEFNVNVATTQSISNMNTLEKWKPQSVTKFQEDCASHGDLLWEPLTKEGMEQIEKKISSHGVGKEEQRELLIELEKDYEQVDSERMIFGQETTQMKFAEHPQYAENVEDQMAAFQTYGDYLMYPWSPDFMKHEKLANMQDENRRKLFLERFETASKMYFGREETEQPVQAH